MKITDFTFPVVLQQVFQNHGSHNALAHIDEPPITYKELKKRIYRTVAFYEQLGIQPGDKVAILSNNMPNWGIAFFAATYMGAVAVPLLPDFTENEIANILEHSETKSIIVSENLHKKIAGYSGTTVQNVIKIEDFSVISGHKSAQYAATDIPRKTYQVEEDSLASIIYTSGTTGKSKGVMLSHKNIIFNALKSKDFQEVGPGDRFLSILPLSHAYENTIGFVLPIISGACIYYLGRPPTPNILLPALKKIQPTMMLSVPLIIEKIYRNKILPEINNNTVISKLYKIPAFRKFIHLKAGKKLKDTFGGQLKFFGIGGAKLDPAVDRFLKEAQFPYAIGYGLTETAPLLAGSSVNTTKLRATGKAIDGISLRINNPDPKTGEGEIWAKGPTVMQGYYKEPGLTREVITEDGWFKTGDLGVFDRSNTLYIKGRLKNVIVGASGENIYPEEIEAEINNFRYVFESLVVEQKGKLVALVHLNYDELEAYYQNFKAELSNYAERKIEDFKQELKAYINEKVNGFSRVNMVMIQPEPFQKTATYKIKRFLYT